MTRKAKKAQPHKASPRTDVFKSEDGDILVTMRVADCKHPVRGSVTQTCALCDAAVYVSPSSFAAFVGRALPPIWCAQCTLAFARRGGTA